MVYVIVILVLLGLAALAVLVTVGRRPSPTGTLSRETRRRDHAARTTTTPAAAAGPGTALTPTPTRTPAPYEPLDEEQLGVTRRQFFNRSLLGVIGLALATFGGGVLAFLWPQASGGFGSKITAGKLSDILDQITTKQQPVYIPEARTYIRPYPKADLPKAKKVYEPTIYKGMEQGVVALYQKCPHLGCRVPWCQSSQWFECPCHGSKYDHVGEKRDGPAPRGMDHFAVEINGGTLVVNTGLLALGPPIGTNTTDQKAEGPHCS